LYAVLFAIPFIAGWFAVFFVIIGLCFGRERLGLSRAGLTYRWKALVPLKTQEVSLDDVKGIRQFATARDSDTNTRRYGLRIRTGGGDIRFGKGASGEELLWLADTIRRHIHALDPRLLASPRAVTETARPREVATKVGDDAEVLEPGSIGHERPAGTDITLRRDFNRTEFVRRGSWRGMLGTFAVLTFINLFWNGIIAVGVYSLVMHFQWFVFFFLIPFVAIGLVMLAFWLLVVTAPLWRRGWVFTPSEIISSSTVLGISRTRHHKLEQIERVELRPNTARKKRLRGTEDDEEADGSCSLVLVGAGRDLIEIDTLAEKEARWIADVLFADFRQWFILR